jgi:uncharacterized membrane protein HdeD (DUF308 family)
MRATGQAATTSSQHPHRLFADVADNVVAKSRYWWLLVVAGVAWIVAAVMILRITDKTVATIALLFGGICVVVAATEVLMGAISSRRWRIAHWLLAVVFVVVAVMALLAMKATLAALAAVISFFFISRGAFDVVAALAASKERGWQLLLMVGLGELALGFWGCGAMEDIFFGADGLDRRGDDAARGRPDLFGFLGARGRPRCCYAPRITV